MLLSSVFNELVGICLEPAKQQLLTAADSSWKAVVAPIFGQKKKNDRLVHHARLEIHGGFAVVARDKHCLYVCIFIYIFFKFSVLRLFSTLAKLLMQSAGRRKSDFGSFHHCGYLVVSIVSSCRRATALTKWRKCEKNTCSYRSTLHCIVRTTYHTKTIKWLKINHWDALFLPNLRNKSIHFWRSRTWPLKCSSELSDL